LYHLRRNLDVVVRLHSSEYSQALWQYRQGFLITIFKLPLLFVERGSGYVARLLRFIF
jgi:hypothetical protein